MKREQALRHQRSGKANVSGFSASEWCTAIFSVHSIGGDCCIRRCQQDTSALEDSVDPKCLTLSDVYYS